MYAGQREESIQVGTVWVNGRGISSTTGSPLCRQPSSLRGYDHTMTFFTPRAWTICISISPSIIFVVFETCQMHHSTRTDQHVLVYVFLMRVRSSSSLLNESSSLHRVILSPPDSISLMFGKPSCSIVKDADTVA